MRRLADGLYHDILTSELHAAVASALNEGRHIDTPAANPGDAVELVSRHITALVQRAIAATPKDRVEERAQAIVTAVVSAIDDDEVADVLEQYASPLRWLRSVTSPIVGGHADAPTPPLTPIGISALMTNAPGEPRFVAQLQREIASANEVCAVLAFIRRSGLRPLLPVLRQMVASGKGLRVITTTYTNSTELEALQLLTEAGAQVRVSYDLSGSRLHAKAWLFVRESGHSTAFIGSSNLTHQAQTTGLEWNVRVASAQNPAIIGRVQAAFDSYWESADFVAFDADEFRARTDAMTSRSGSLGFVALDIRLEPFQEQLLERLAVERENGHHRNLLVAATGTGKTVMAAVDFARMYAANPRLRLLFVAHRQEILEQALVTFRIAVKDRGFGELWVGNEVPRHFTHVFASIQILQSRVDQLAPDLFDVVIVDEFHHAAAPTYRHLLDRLKPAELLGLTATPERGDGVSVAALFGGRIAAELRLWDAIDQGRLVPFHYYAVSDGTDLRRVTWTAGRGYKLEELTTLYTGHHAYAASVARALNDHIEGVPLFRAMAFCAGTTHAEYMAKYFSEHGVPSAVVLGSTSDEERRNTLERLRLGDVRVVFSVDVFNEGVDIPAVDVVMLLRPTDSPTLFTQQIGRGLRRAPGKDFCLILDFVGQHRREFRFDQRLAQLVPIGEVGLVKALKEDFPFLPAGCHIELERVVADQILERLRTVTTSSVTRLAESLRTLESKHGRMTLGGFVRETGISLDGIYGSEKFGWAQVREVADQSFVALTDGEARLRRACSRLRHVDDPVRLTRWRAWMTAEQEPVINLGDTHDLALARMLASAVWRQRDADVPPTVTDAVRILWANQAVRSELAELFDYLMESRPHLAFEWSKAHMSPLRVHATYGRGEILAGLHHGKGPVAPDWREGVRWVPEARADALLITLDKSGDTFSPSTRYRDYAITRELIHWESQSNTRAESATGKRYQGHVAEGSSVLLFVRRSVEQRGFFFAGPATYVRHTGERPMAITWKLDVPLPGDVYRLAAAVA